MDEASKAFGGCAGCREPLGFDISMAFQPIVDIGDRSIIAYEALVRGAAGEPAGTVFSRLTDETLYGFDQACRIKAVEMAATLGLDSFLNINFMPNAVYEPRHCIQSTLAASRRTGFPLQRIVFEVSESERITRQDRLIEILREYREFGFRTAIDDFGAGFAGLSLLANFQPDIVKIDMELVRGIDADLTRRTILKGILDICGSMDIKIIAEGVETADEMKALADLGVTQMQGYLFARPGFQTLPAVDWP
ncbi:EAL domain-containing protein [Iodidimonas sp. SYSU 1G8]|uniref:EAL domain-containing protein n=1 Tax=Iodidimonas sp. SYSU 1G8 TaxID=3133967 RepID=UPI0031FE9579